jgi:hypothetical protein
VVICLTSVHFSREAEVRAVPPVPALLMLDLRSSYSSTAKLVHHCIFLNAFGFVHCSRDSDAVIADVDSAMTTEETEMPKHPNVDNPSACIDHSLCIFRSCSRNLQCSRALVFPTKQACAFRATSAVYLVRGNTNIRRRLETSEYFQVLADKGHSLECQCLSCAFSFSVSIPSPSAWPNSKAFARTRRSTRSQITN